MQILVFQHLRNKKNIWTALVENFLFFSCIFICTTRRQWNIGRACLSAFAQFKVKNKQKHDWFSQQLINKYFWASETVRMNAWLLALTDYKYFVYFCQFWLSVFTQEETIFEEQHCCDLCIITIYTKWYHKIVNLSAVTEKQKITGLKHACLSVFT